MTTDTNDFLFDQFMPLFDPEDEAEGKRLKSLFEQHRPDVAQAFENSFPKNWPEEYTRGWSGPTIDFAGPCFHKQFRQIDVTPSGEVDSEIWALISKSKTFWVAMRAFCQQQDADGQGGSHDHH